MAVHIRALSTCSRTTQGLILRLWPHLDVNIDLSCETAVDSARVTLQVAGTSRHWSFKGRQG